MDNARKAEFSYDNETKTIIIDLTTEENINIIYKIPRDKHEVHSCLMADEIFRDTCFDFGFQVPVGSNVERLIKLIVDDMFTLKKYELPGTDDILCECSFTAPCMGWGMKTVIDNEKFDRCMKCIRHMAYCYSYTDTPEEVC